MKNEKMSNLVSNLNDYPWQYHKGQEGRDDVQRWKTPVGGFTSETLGLTYGICELPYEAIQWPHYHAEHEIYHAYQGEAKMLLGEELIAVECGSVVYIPGNLPHGTI